MKRTIMAITALTLTACTAPNYTPAVAEFNGNSVTLHTDINAVYLPESGRAALRAETQAEARRICAKGSKRKAEYVSSRVVMTSKYTGHEAHLFLCL